VGGKGGPRLSGHHLPPQPEASPPHGPAAAPSSPGKSGGDAASAAERRDPGPP
ncbi:hypothetical protein P7K49_004885, partial [Saguinus oedipus]